jgi:unsaturated chondroitin disaccharide hydrolase
VIDIDLGLSPRDLSPSLERFWDISACKIDAIENDYDSRAGSPVFTARGKYQSRGWTEWTQGFQYGSALLQFEATGEARFLTIGRDNTLRKMASHVSHLGVHDHGFNNVSTYGNLLRLMLEGRLRSDDWQRHFAELALKVSGAVQASRFTVIGSAGIDGGGRQFGQGGSGGFLYSFNGPHSLFVDTVRSCRSLVVAHLLGHALMSENDRRVNLLGRAIDHLRATACYSIYYGEGRDAYDVWGRTAHESIFNVNDGNYRCPSSQQGYSPFSTWTRGLAWAMCGFAEQLELVAALPDAELEPFGGRAAVEEFLTRAARASSDFYIAHTPTCGVPYWDTGAPGLSRLGTYLERPAEPENPHEPVDSSAAAIAAQGLLRLGAHLGDRLGEPDADARRYKQAGLSVLRTLFGAPYLSLDPAHQGLLLHSVYHRPNGWDYVAPGRQVPSGESSMWGDYHLREAALCVERLISGGRPQTFFGGLL